MIFMISNTFKNNREREKEKERERYEIIYYIDYIFYMQVNDGIMLLYTGLRRMGIKSTPVAFTAQAVPLRHERLP